MIIKNNVYVNSHARNKKYFLALGYVEEHRKFYVKIADLMPTSPVVIEVICDYCNKPKYIKYVDYIKTKSEFISKDACLDCAAFKREEILSIKVNHNTIHERKNRGYWSSRENIYKELMVFINKNSAIGRVNNQNNEWRKIKNALGRLGITVDQAVHDLGFDINSLLSKKPNGYYDDFDVIQQKIASFVYECHRFPTQEDMRQLGIHGSQYLKHGTLDEIKVMLSYNDSHDLVDTYGFINKSSYELITANFLIANHISYRREQYPFKKFNNILNYKSDFTFYLNTGEEIHCEIWGGKRSSKGSVFKNYAKTMELKKKLYLKYNIKLISIEPNTFKNSVKNIQEQLIQIFSPIFGQQIEKVENSLLSTNTLRNMTDFDLCKELLKFSDDGLCLPSEYKLRPLSKAFLYTEALKRYDSYADFALATGTLTAQLKRKQLLTS